MSRTIAKYYPQSDGITPSEPSSCYCGHGNNFKVISIADKGDKRYLCKNCGQSYILKSPEKDRQQISKMGSILDSIILGMSSRQTRLKMFIDGGHTIAHNTVLNWSKKYIQYAKMFTDDILCCLEYGKAWGIDETEIGIRGWWHDADPKLLSEMKALDEREKQGLLDDGEFKKEWENLRERSENSKHSSKKKWLTSVLDLKTRMIIHYIITDKRPDNKQIYGLVKTSMIVAGMPSDIITDCYKGYLPAMKKLAKYVKQNGGSLNHIKIRAKNQSKLHLSPKKPVNGVPNHNNNIESMWAKIKRNMDIMSGYGEYNSDNVIAYNIINYNFIKPHSSLEAFTATRHGERSSIDMTPAMAAGYPKWFATFEELLTESWGYDKSFVFKIRPDMLKRLRIGIRNKREVILSAKERTSMSMNRKIDRKLQVECGFEKTHRKNEWVRQMPSILNMNRRREENMGDVMPDQTFEVCNRCGKTAITTQAVSEEIGYRRSNGRMITQPNCHKCRSELSKNPKRPTGPNSKRMGKRKMLMGRFQQKIDEV